MYAVKKKFDVEFKPFVCRFFLFPAKSFFGGRRNNIVRNGRSFRRNSARKMRNFVLFYQYSRHSIRGTKTRKMLRFPGLFQFNPCKRNSLFSILLVLLITWGGGGGLHFLGKRTHSVCLFQLLLFKRSFTYIILFGAISFCFAKVTVLRK